jgi:hypothetical protein
MDAGECPPAMAGRALEVERRIQYGWSWGAERERFPGRQESVSLRPLRSVVTWENGSEHSGSLCFADTEEVTGSNPVAPTIPELSRAFRRLNASRLWADRRGGWVQRPKNTSLFTRGVLFRGSQACQEPQAHRRLRPRSTVQHRHTVGTEGPGRM